MGPGWDSPAPAGAGRQCLCVRELTFEARRARTNHVGIPQGTLSLWVLVHEFPVPERYNVRTVTAAIRIETGYPIARLDMVYFHPALVRSDGKPIKATQVMQTIDGKQYQRWSRHRTKANPWQPGEDSLGTHVILIEDWLEREFGR